MQGPSVVVIDDDLGVRQLISDILQAEGARVALARNSEEGIAIVHREPPDVLFVDLRLPGRDGIATIEEVRRFLPQLPIVVVTGFGSFESSVEALRLGVVDYVTKPITAKKISLALSRAVATNRRPKDPHTAAAELRKAMTHSAPAKLVAASSAMRDVIELAERVAHVAVPVLIEGETGVGKEMIARLIHSHSERAGRPFIRVTGAAIREEQLEQALFGHSVHGSQVSGLVEQAHSGTLFLHNVTDLPCWIQGQLLNVLQQGWFARPNSDERVEIDLRVIASTSVPLQSAVARDEFLKGLYYFLSIVPIPIDPLRLRRDDIRPLIDHFLNDMSSQRNGHAGIPRVKFSSESLNCLLEYHWPGNVQELANVVKRSVLLATGDEITLAEFPDLRAEKVAEPARDSITVPLSGDLKIIERHIITEVIKRCQGNKAAAARALGLHRKTLYRLLEGQSAPLATPGQASTAD